MSKRKETFIVTADFDKYDWEDATLNGTPVKIATDDNGWYIHADSWHAFLPCPVKHLIYLEMSFHFLLTRLERSKAVREGNSG